MEETDRLFTCPYCRVKSYLVTKDFFRYMFPHQSPKDKQLVFFPYWRIKGILYACNPQGVNQKFMDVSHQAVASNCIPHSVGLRSQALRLQFVTRQTEGRFLKPTLSLGHVFRTFEHLFSKTLSQPVLHQSHIGETISLIYSPAYIMDKIYDAVLNRPVSSRLPDDFDIDQFQGGPPHWQIRFIPTLCPKCGWDLEGERDSLVLLCKNCTTAWYAVDKSLKQLKFGFYPGTGKKIGLYLPFWRIRADITGIQLDSYADLIKVANLPRVAQNGCQQLGFRFWVPAFKLPPRVFLRLSTHMTLSQPSENLTVELPGIRHQPITMPIGEAVESLKMNLFSFIKPRSTLMDIVSQIGIDAKSIVLAYIPLQEGHHEFIHPQLQFAINKNTLRLSKNL